MASSERVDDNNQALHLQGRRRQRQPENTTVYQNVLGIAPRSPVSEEDRILESIMHSPLAMFFQVTLKDITDELPRRTLIVSDNHRTHGGPFRNGKPLTPALDDFSALEGFMTNLLQERKISPSNTSIVNDDASSSIRQAFTPSSFNESFLAADDISFTVETKYGELIPRHLSIFGHASSSSRMFESFSTLDLEEDTQPHICENIAAILRHQDDRSSDFIDNTPQHEDLEEGDDRELSPEDFTIFGESSISSVNIFQESFHKIQGPDEEIDLGKYISPTDVKDRTFLHPPLSLKKINDDLFNL